MRYKDHRDPEYYIQQVRAHEYAERQKVSLLDLTGLRCKTKGSRNRMRTLWKCGITTAADLLTGPVEDLVDQLVGLPPFSRDRSVVTRQVNAWRAEIGDRAADSSSENQHGER